MKGDDAQFVTRKPLAEIEKSLKKVDKKANRVLISNPKVTEAELIRRKEAEQGRCCSEHESIEEIAHVLKKAEGAPSCSEHESGGRRTILFGD
ncbi:hypothetical protein E3N88_36402 [Mikania micrantha]|uniref:Uncharacterized protein n=1 Tax=Mikania micrantha TaxID=192012 RepID=A0A5N6M452_9ASTR|nr:hypothetical protein E3N88_36402 [Mikania micrantha]